MNNLTCIDDLIAAERSLVMLAEANNYRLAKQATLQNKKSSIARLRTLLGCLLGKLSRCVWERHPLMATINGKN